jgi:hypothetical protein
MKECAIFATFISTLIMLVLDIFGIVEISFFNPIYLVAVAVIWAISFVFCLKK